MVSKRPDPSIATIIPRRARPTYCAPDAERVGEVIDLPSDEAAHLTVLRLKTGAAIRVFNGRGREFDGVVDVVSRNHVRVRIDGACEVTAAEPRVSITLAAAVLKGDKMDDVIRDTVMMGATAIQPIVTTRTEVTLAALQRGRRRERWSALRFRRPSNAGVRRCRRFSNRGRSPLSPQRSVMLPCRRRLSCSSNRQRRTERSRSASLRARRPAKPHWSSGPRVDGRRRNSISAPQRAVS